MSRVERLNAAMEAAGLSKADFQRAINHEPGCSIPTVYRYIRGSAEMPLLFVEIAAAVLNVKPGWLAFGEGEALGYSTMALRRVRSSLEKALDVVEGALHPAADEP